MVGLMHDADDGFAGDGNDVVGAVGFGGAEELVVVVLGGAARDAEFGEVGGVGIVFVRGVFDAGGLGLAGEFVGDLAGDEDAFVEVDVEGGGGLVGVVDGDVAEEVGLIVLGGDDDAVRVLAGDSGKAVEVVVAGGVGG